MSTRVTDKDIMELIKIRDTLKKYKESLEKNKMEMAINLNVKEKKDVAIERMDLEDESLKNLNKEDLLELLEKLKEIKKEIEKGKQKEDEKKTTKTKSSKSYSKSDSKVKSTRKKDEVESYKKLREKLLNNLRALEKLYSDGIIDEETYKKSRTELKRKISCVDEIILTKIKIDEINSLKDEVIQLLKSRIRGGVFLEEEKQIKEDIQALKALYEEGIISESEFKEKLNFLQQKLKSKNEIMEEIILIFETWEKRLEERVEVLKQEVEGKKEEYKAREEAYTKNESIIDKLFSLRKEDSKKEISGEVTTPFEKLKEVYTKEKGMYAIGDMVLILKKEIERRLNCERELTHQELINALKKSDFDKDLKEELIEFFKEVSQKEYTGEISDEEVHAIYERCRAFLERILNIGKEKQKKSKEEKIETPKVEIEEKEIVSKLKNVEEEKKKKKKGLIDKINEFFGV